MREIAPDQRLPAGQADVGDAHRGQQRHQPRDLLEGEDVRAVEPRQPLRRHAVLAAEVAAVGDRHAEVADEAAVTIDERWGLEPGVLERGVLDRGAGHDPEATLLR